MAHVGDRRADDLSLDCAERERHHAMLLDERRFVGGADEQKQRRVPRAYVGYRRKLLQSFFIVPCELPGRLRLGCIEGREQLADIVKPAEAREGPDTLT